MDRINKYTLLLILIFQITLIKGQIKDNPGRVDSLDIIHYDIHLDIMNFTARQIKGYTEVTVTPKINSINFVTLDLLKLKIDSIKENDKNVSNFRYNDTLIKIRLSKQINIKDTIKIRVYYQGKPQLDPSTNHWGGFYFTGDYAFNLGVGMKSVPHSIGRFWFPCIDDFRSKSLYDYYIRTEGEHTAVCGGMLQNLIDNGDGTRSFHWKQKERIPTYLASVAVSRYAAVKDTYKGIKGNIPIIIYVKPEDTAKARMSFKNLKSILNHFEKSFGTYQWERVGYTGVPFYYGAMEHATNIAIPDVSIDGTTGQESTFAHELSHHWFGDLVTCTTAEDMWMNEGWAAFSETVYIEGLYGKQKYKDYVRDNHKYVLQYIDKADNGYRAVYGLPSDMTYSSTVYDKGSDVVHTLRNYTGDTLFFKTVKDFMHQYAFRNANTEELKNYFSTKTGINLTDFFSTWVYGKGFPHFSIDSFRVVKMNSAKDYSVKVYIRQRLKGTEIFSKSNRLEVTFRTKEALTYTDTIIFSGQYGSKIFHVPFNPELAMVDINEKIQDATTDNYLVIKKNDSYDFLDTYFYMTVNNVADSVFVRAEHNWVAPDKPKKMPEEIIRISDTRYWKIDIDNEEKLNAKGRFYYSKAPNFNNGYLDNTLLPGNKSADSLILIYRKNTADDWKIVSFTKTGNQTNGYLYTDNLKSGEYCLGIGKPFQSVNDLKKSNIKFKIYPNPSAGDFEIEYDLKEKSAIKIFDLKGSLVDSLNVEAGHNIISWGSKKRKAGTYVFELTTDNYKTIISKRVVKL